MKADGIARKGHTKCKQLGIDGAKVGIDKGGLKTAGVKNIDLKKMGRGLATVKNQKGS